MCVSCPERVDPREVCNGATLRRVQRHINLEAMRVSVNERHSTRKGKTDVTLRVNVIREGVVRARIREVLLAIEI